MHVRRSALFRGLKRSIGREHVAIFVVALVLRGYLFVDPGPLVVRDATRYIEWCGDLSASTLFGTRALVYAGYWLPYCGWLQATSGFVDGWVAIQLGLSALTCVLVYDTARRLVGNRAGIAAGLFLAVQWEVYKWAIRAQSEFMLTFVVAVTLWRLTIYHESPTLRNRLLVLVGLAFVASVRPNGLPIVLGYLVYDMFPRGSDRRLNLFFAARTNIAIAGTVGLLALYRLSFGWARGSALWPWKAGIVITPNRFVYEYTPAPAGDALSFFLHNLGHVIVIALLRGLWFFAPVMPGWSLGHALLTGVTLTPLTVVAGLGIYRAARRDRVLLQLWGTPLAMVVLTAMAIWVAGWRNFMGPAAVVYALFAGYYVADAGVLGRLWRWLAGAESLSPPSRFPTHE